jgi:photosystem II stability/assembly factor-like uncharacterized protein
MPNTHRLYVGTIGEGLFRSLDGGETFARACEGMFVECHVRALAVHPQDPRTIFMGSEQGLYRTTDGADHWTRVESPLNGQQIWSILLVPRNPVARAPGSGIAPGSDIAMVVGTCPSRLFRSEDRGKTWTEPAVRMLQECPRIMHTRLTCLSADPQEPETLWAGVEIDGIFRSRDLGRTWEAVGQGLSSRDIHAVTFARADKGRWNMLAATNNDLNLSTDRGENWQPLKIGNSMPWSYCRTLGQPIGRNAEVLLGNGDAPPGSAGLIGRSTDGGQTWRPACMPGRANSTIWNFAVHAADPQLIYAASVSGEIYRSTDAGQSWSKLAREFGEVRALAWTL